MWPPFKNNLWTLLTQCWCWEMQLTFMFIWSSGMRALWSLTRRQLLSQVVQGPLQVLHKRLHQQDAAVQQGTHTTAMLMPPVWPAFFVLRRSLHHYCSPSVSVNNAVWGMFGLLALTNDLRVGFGVVHCLKNTYWLCGSGSEQCEKTRKCFYADMAVSSSTCLGK